METISSIPSNHLLLARQVGQILLSEHLFAGTAESCTGGKIATLLSALPGSSAYFKGGIVAYSNSVKQSLLNVSAHDLEQHGAVSRSVVEQMAQGAARILECNCAVATSGIAGPGGGSAHKPAGTVWMATVCHGTVRSACHHFSGNRQQVIEQSAGTALQMLLDLLKETIALP